MVPKRRERCSGLVRRLEQLVARRRRPRRGGARGRCGARPRPTCASSSGSRCVPRGTTSSVSGGKSAAIESRSPCVVVLARPGRPPAARARRPRRACERCVVRSKWRRSTISSPQNSRRTGSAMPKRVDVEDAAAHAELRDVLHHRHALEADATRDARRDRVEPLRRRPCAARAARSRARAGSRVRSSSARARGDEHAHLAAREPLERLDALARDLHVRLGLAESFARRIERHRRLDRRAHPDRRASARPPAAPRRGSPGNAWSRARAERGAERRIAGAGEPADVMVSPSEGRLERSSR